MITNEEVHELIRTMAEVKTKVDDTHQRLFGGDGIDGELPLVKDRVTVLEADKNHARGMLKTIAWLSGILGGTEILHIFKKGF